MIKATKILICSLVISILISMIPFESACSGLHSDVLRLHILANSDSEQDQQLKLAVRDKVLQEISPLYTGIKSKDQAISITKDNLNSIISIASTVISDSGYDYRVDAVLTNRFFDTRYYDDFTMPAGMYDTLEISIGNAQGHNWWCVMYPSLCVGASSKISMKEDLTDSEYKVITSGDIEYRFKIVEYYEKVASFFR